MKNKDLIIKLVEGGKWFELHEDFVFHLGNKNIKQIKMKNIKQIKTTILGVIFISLGVWRVFFDAEPNGYEGAYYGSIIGGVLLILSPDDILAIIKQKITENGKS